MREKARLGSNKPERGSFFAKDCDNLNEAMDRRRQLVKEITQKMSDIQNAGLGEHRLRELNDEINTLLRRKFQWDKRVQILGGPMLVDNGKSDGGRYKYFGAARDLPQVRELLAKPVAKVSKKRSREEIRKNITYKYYDSVIEETENKNGLLLAEEALEDKLRGEFAAEVLPTMDIQDGEAGPVSDFEQLLIKTAHYSTLSFLTPQQKEELDTSKAMESLVVERKKRELMSKYLLN